MATIQALLDDINLRYRNTYTTDQKLVWMNEEQTDLFEVFEIDSVPYAFTTIEDNFFYPIDTGIDIDRIKVVSIQINDADPATFQDLPFKPNRPSEYASETEYWYSIVENNFFINVPGGALDDRLVYIYTDTGTTEIGSSSLGIEPATPKRYQEILKLGTLERIAAARKDFDMKTNFANDKEAKIADIEWKMKMSVPEWAVPVDTMPKAGRNRNGRSLVRYTTS